MPTIDPVVNFVLRGGIAAILGLAAWHKLMDRNTFEEQLAAYALLPVGLLHPFSRAIPLIETALAIALLVRFEHAATGAVALFALYAGAMGINLVRGRRDIDCGCDGLNGKQMLHPVLVIRNIVLMAIALATLLPLSARSLIWADYVIALLATLSALALYTALNTLIANVPSTNRLKA